MKYTVTAVRNGYIVGLDDIKSFSERHYVIEGASHPVAALKRALALDEDQMKNEDHIKEVEHG